MQRQSVKGDLLAQQITRGARNGGDDRGVASGQLIHQAGFAGIWLAGQHQGHAVTQQNPIARGVTNVAQFFQQGIEAGGNLEVGEEIHLLFGEIDTRLDIHA